MDELQELLDECFVEYRTREGFEELINQQQEHVEHISNERVAPSDIDRYITCRATTKQNGEVISETRPKSHGFRRLPG